jgi:oxepin-CoA hydrolase/3-oxo-5,6-dehydrosuberyl-CoA semialdehyde dehydrogenase
MKQLGSFLQGQWQPGTGDEVALMNPTTEATVATVRHATDLDKAVAYGRDVGGPALRAMSYAERGELLSSWSKAIYEHREDLIALAIENGGNTRGDAKFDIDGALGVLALYAEIAQELGDHPWIVDGEAASLLRGGKLRAQHIYLPRRGLAVHINAFNFPAWGMIGKAAVSLLAGMPTLSKPATSTCVVAHRIVEILHEAELIPAGTFQLLTGSAGDLLDHLGPHDVIAFTGSASTGARIRGHENVIANSVRVNIEADSLNAVVIGADVESGTELFDLVVRDCVTEITQKAGQKCTATRRILVPSASLDAFREILVERLGDMAAITGDPSDKANRMGPLSTKQQLDDGRAGVRRLTEHAKIVRGDPERSEFAGVEKGKGYFMEPILLEATAETALDPKAAFHQTEVFGPVATLLPYDGSAAQASTIVGLGEGSLVSTVYTDDRAFLAEAVVGLAPVLGRLVVADEKIAGASIAPGCVFAAANHGGPGRAGSGEELGGRHGMALYMQRTAIQGGAGQLARLLGTK